MPFHVAMLVLALLLLLPRLLTAHPRPGRPSRVQVDDVEGLQKALEPLLRLSDDEMAALVPERSGLYFVGCPNCDGGTQENQIDWSIDRPDEVFCRFCGMRYPNEQYPDDKVLSVVNPQGETHDYPYYESPDPPSRALQSSLPALPPDEGYRYFFQAKGWYVAREYLADAASNLARLYELTDDRSYARKCVLILDRFAQVYPGYCVHHDLPFSQKIVFPGTQRFPYPVQEYRAAKWSWWAYMDIPWNLIRSYERVRDSGEITDEMSGRIENNFFHASVGFVREIPDLLTNMDPTLLNGLIVAGLVLGEPDYIHDSVGRIGRLVERQFYRDGMWREGTVSYHNQTVRGLMRLIDLLDGYSDPEGYVHPGDGTRYDSLDLLDQYPILEKARGIPEMLKYPNGRVVAFHDVWARSQEQPTEATGPMLLPGVGQARLGRGEGARQMQVQLHFSGGYGHQHADLLSLTLYSHGQERLTDMGYTHTRYRRWTTATLAHNTVMVDGQDQDPGWRDRPTDGNLLLYLPGNCDFQAAEASGLRGYPEVVSDYRRMLVLIGISPEDAYVVDLFRVSGGSRHEHVLLGDADHDGAVETDLSLSNFGPNLLPPGVSVTYPTGESVQGDAEGHNLAYAFVRNVRAAESPDAWSATLTSEAPTRGALKIHGFSEPGTRLLVGSAPSIRRAEEDDAKVDDFTMPVLIRRREGDDLVSAFATVLEPHGGRPLLTSVERLPLVDGAQGDVALKITWGDRVDYLISSASGDDRTLQAGGVVLNGRLGFVRERNGEV
ncbi:MAG: heparinase II/III family protein, partial [Candidatus Latescibacteria bacterium]|nr:heparinase II/III family protein [Candidatus Latescibacterota bacterium]